MYIAIDFDGTIADYRFPEIGEPVPGAFDWMQQFRQAGATLILWTVRSDGERYGPVLTEAKQFCEDQGVKFLYVNEGPEKISSSNKVFANLYIDDSAFGCPLIENPRKGGKPYVDWDQVGPAVLKQIRPPRSPFDF